MALLVACIFIALSSSTSLTKVTESKSSPLNGTDLASFPSSSSNLRDRKGDCTCSDNAFHFQHSERCICTCKFGYHSIYANQSWVCVKVICTKDADCTDSNAYCDKDQQCKCKPGTEVPNDFPDICSSASSLSSTFDVGFYVVMGIIALVFLIFFVCILIASIPYCTNSNAQAPNYETLKGANYRRNPHYHQKQLPQGNTESQLAKDGVTGGSSREAAATTSGQKQVSSVGSTGGKTKSKYTKQGFDALLDYYRNV